MRVVFMGTPEFAATILECLCEQHQVVAVFTRPDAIRGRGKKLVASAVKQTAQRHDIPVYEYATLNNNDAKTVLKHLSSDIICVAAYGCLVPKTILELPRFGCVNVHASLLPRWRGAAPVERAILAGDAQTGVSIMRMEEGLDTGDYCAVRTVEIKQRSASSLTHDLAELGARALLVALSQIELGQAVWTVQDNAKATYAAKLEKGELNISPSQTSQEAARCVQASSEAHTCRCSIALKPVTVLKACSVACDAVPPTNLSLNQGDVVFVAKRLFLSCSEGVLEVLEVKPDGKKAMDAASFAAGIQGIKQTGALWQGLQDV